MKTKKKKKSRDNNTRKKGQSAFELNNLWGGDYHFVIIVENREGETWLLLPISIKHIVKVDGGAFKLTYTRRHIIRPTRKKKQHHQHRKNVCDFPLLSQCRRDGICLVSFGAEITAFCSDVEKTLKGDHVLYNLSLFLTLPFFFVQELNSDSCLLVGGLICHNCTKHVTLLRSLRCSAWWNMMSTSEWV